MPRPDRHDAGGARVPRHHAFDQRLTLAAHLGGRPVLVFLDYDGTLCPIVARPQDAVLADDMRETLARLAEHHVVGVVSGRELTDLRARVGLAGLCYAGNHGFEWSAPAGAAVRCEAGAEYLADVAALAARLATDLAHIDGVLVENKRYSLSVHYRQVAPAREDEVADAVHAAAAAHPRLAVRRGKCVLEVLPRIDWHKGKAVRRLMAAAATPGGVPLYIGDDITDEDAFRELCGDGVGVQVSETPRPSAAQYWLRDVVEVQRLLDWLTGGRAAGA